MLACAEMLHEHTSAEIASAAAAQLLGLVHAHPLTAALLALRRVDGAALRSVLPRCDAAARARVLRIAQSSTWFDAKTARLAAKELAVHDGRQAAKHGAPAGPAHKSSWAQRAAASTEGPRSSSRIVRYDK